MNSRRQKGVLSTAPWAWPGRKFRHAGLIDFGLVGGVSFQPKTRQWVVARDPKEYLYERASPLVQMLPRVRPYEPRPVEAWPQETSRAIDSAPMEATLNNSIRFLSSVHVNDWFPEDIVHDVLAESSYQDFNLAYYDPYQGNHCAVGYFAGGLPVVATPYGPTGADLAISLAQHKPKLQPPVNLLAPKSSLVSFSSAICQVAMPSEDSKKYLEEQVLVRSRESISIVATSSDAPSAISRVDPSHVEVIATIPSRLGSDNESTIHAAISPHTPDKYALLGDKGSVKIWTLTPAVLDANSTQQDLKIWVVSKGRDEPVADPWRSCAWGAHPEHLVVASRRDVKLLDCRARNSKLTLFQPRSGETVQCIQEDNTLPSTPFLKFVASSHQLACIDERFSKRPLLSWAHQMNRNMPFGIKALEFIEDGKQGVTVLAWSKRDAEVTAYNVSMATDEPMTLASRGQQLPSFHLHPQYTNSSSLRDPLKRPFFKTTKENQLQQPVKPPLSGLDVLPTRILDDGEEEDEDDDEDETKKINPLSVATSKFSLIQYASTGAVYAQEIEVKASPTDIERPPKMSFGMDFPDGPYESDLITLGSLSSKLVTQDDLEFEESEAIDKLLAATEADVAPWKRGVKAEQLLADKEALTHNDVRRNVDLDLQKLLENLKIYMLRQQDQDQPGSTELDVRAKMREAMRIITDSREPKSLYDILKQIGMASSSNSRRKTMANAILEAIKQEPLITANYSDIHHRTVHNIWPKKMNLRVESQLRHGNVKAVERLLTETYPLPSHLSKDATEAGITSQLASLRFPEDQARTSSKTSLDVNESGPDDKDQSQWSSSESRHIRSITIRRLAQDLVFMTTTVVSMIEPEISAGQSLAEEDDTRNRPVFQYLFKTPKDENDQTEPTPVKTTIPSAVLDIWSEWKVGQDPELYVYRPFSILSGKIGQDSDHDEEDEAFEAQEREARLLELRRKREKRAQRVRTTRMNDLSYNANAGGSASQPNPLAAGGFLTETESFSQSQLLGEADDDGMFSLPTVISASQPSIRKSTTSSLSQKASKLKFSQKPASKASGTADKGESGKDKMPSRLFGVQPMLSLDHAMFQTPTFLSSSQDWEDSLLRDDSQLGGGGGGSNLFSSSQVSVGDGSGSLPSLSQDESLSQSQSHDQSQSQDGGGFMWGASQPVRGTFAQRRQPPEPKKAKKKKPRTQGF
ncbi:TATA box-binding protein-associated factor RNA polymerase I subunit C [Gryganskiella cystojenkinii]|nr:TATA box-binding protein-associated factor RNA polymerase I subunit C [Gryganskiella cystojenkinii]